MFFAGNFESLETQISQYPNNYENKRVWRKQYKTHPPHLSMGWEGLIERVCQFSGSVSIKAVWTLNAYQNRGDMLEPTCSWLAMIRGVPARVMRSDGKQYIEKQIKSHPPRTHRKANTAQSRPGERLRTLSMYYTYLLLQVFIMLW